MDHVTLTIIGCGDAFSSGGNGTTCFYLRSGLQGVLIDCGATALEGLKKWKLSSDFIDVVILTHYHGDHYGGLPYLILDAARLKRKKPLTIISPPGGRQKLENLFFMLYPGTEVVFDKLDLEYHSFQGRQTISVKELSVASFPVRHTKETCPYGIRITTEGITVGYSGDTEWTDTIPEIFDGADLALCECTFYEQEEKGHLNYKTLVQHLSELNCKKLVLTHFDEEMIRNFEQVKVSLAKDGAVYKLK